MSSIFQQAVQRPFRYRYDYGPDKVHGLETAEASGLNCGALVHLLTKELFRVELPKTLMCFELIYDSHYFRDVITQENTRPGDLLIVGRPGLTELLNIFAMEYEATGHIANIKEHPRVHLLMYTGQFASIEDPLLIHATPYSGGGVKIWPLSKVRDYHHYSQLYKQRRLKKEFIASTVL